MRDRVVEHLRANRTVTLAQVRDMFGTSRKYAQSLLEHLDAQHVTRRVGDERVLRAK
jgi:selenocysteine-specific elongation factor